MSRWEKSHTRNKLQSFCTFHQIFTVKTLKTPLNTHLKFFRISIFWGKTNFSSIRTLLYFLILPFLQAKVYWPSNIFYWHQSALKKRLLRLNDLEWTLNFFIRGHELVGHISTLSGSLMEHRIWTWGVRFLIGTQIFSSFYALDETNSTSFCYLLVLHAGKTFPSLQSHESPQRHERTET